MATYDLGATVPLRFTVYNDDEPPVPTTPVDAIVVITKPDGTAPTLGSPIVDSPGQCDFDFTEADIPGRYRARFTSTDPDCTITDTFDVWPADPRFIISLADLRDELNVPAGVTVNDDELRLYIAAATAVIEDIVGTVLAQTHTETFDGGKVAVLLSERAASITSVTVNGIATTDFVANLASGIVYAGTTSAPRSFQAGRQNVVVTYVAGGNAVDSNVVLAARIIAAHQYQVGQQAKKRDRNTLPEDYALSSSGYAVPRRAMQLLAPSMSGRMPGFA